MRKFNTLGFISIQDRTQLGTHLQTGFSSKHVTFIHDEALSPLVT